MKKIAPTWQDGPIQFKEPLPPEVVQAISTINTWIICCDINWTSRRQEIREQTQRALKSFVVSLDDLSFAEHMERRERAAKRAKKQEPTMLQRQKRSA